jgi:hypothetical protein
MSSSCCASCCTRLEAEGEFVDVLPGLKREAVPLLAQLLHRHLPDVVEADAHGDDGVLGVLGGGLVR